MNIHTQRALGEELGISVATAIPFEEVITKDDTKVEHLYINLRTVLRNYRGSLEIIPTNLSTVEFYEYVVEEILTIESLCEDIKSVTFYVCNLAFEQPNVFKGYVKLKEPSTANQKEYYQLESGFISYLKETKPFDFKEFNLLLQGNQFANVTILTHIPLDLLSNYSFGSLTLIESHTGKLKHATEWHSKLTNGDNIAGRVFNMLTLGVYGDKSTNFFAQPLSVKQSLETLAIKGRWNPLTTKSKILAQIKSTPIPDDHKELFTGLLTKVHLN